MALREEMSEGWQPRNGLEHALIDMLAMSFSLWLHWTELAHGWATGFIKESIEIEERVGLNWRPPNIKVAEAVERANPYADGYNRQFLRTLRQLRDLRRYHVAIINQPGGQVNVATDGGQQVNVSGT